MGVFDLLHICNTRSNRSAPSWPTMCFSSYSSEQLNFDRLYILGSADERGPNRRGLDSIFVTAIKIRTPFSSWSLQSTRRIKPITKHVATQYHWIASWYKPVIHFAPRCSVNNLYLYWTSCMISFQPHSLVRQPVPTSTDPQKVSMYGVLWWCSIIGCCTRCGGHWYWGTGGPLIE